MTWAPHYDSKRWDILKKFWANHSTTLNNKFTATLNEIKTYERCFALARLQIADNHWAKRWAVLVDGSALLGITSIQYIWITFGLHLKFKDETRKKSILIKVLRVTVRLRSPLPKALQNVRRRSSNRPFSICCEQLNFETRKLSDFPNKFYFIPLTVSLSCFCTILEVHVVESFRLGS